MPSGPPELHKFWSDYGPHEYGDLNACEYLYSQGYKEERFEFYRPSLTHEPTELELSALNYLIWEWDYGGICDYGSLR